MKKKLKKFFQKTCSILMIIGVSLSSFSGIPFSRIPEAHALASVDGDKIIETAQTYSGYTYDGVGTCTGLVTRTLNKLGIGQSVVGIHPYDINTPQSSGGARYSPDAMYKNAMAHPEDAQFIWRGKKKDVEANAKLFKNGDLIIERIEDRNVYTGNGHVSFMHIYGDTIASYGAGSNGIKDSVYATGVSFVSIDPYGIMPINTPPWVDGEDYINVFRLTAVEPKYEKLTSSRTANENVEVSFYKTDKETGKPLSGVTVEFYRDDVKFATTTTGADGYARATSSNTFTAESEEKEYCTNYDELDEEGRQAVADRGAYKNKIEAQAIADEEAQRSANIEASKTHRYTVIETQTKTKYWLDENNNTVSDSLTGSGSIGLNLKNERVKGSATIKKIDYDTTIAQNEATLDGAIYSLIAKENILDPADATVIYRAGEEVTRVRIENGEARVDDLYLGSYEWREVTPSEGYKLDPTVYPFSLNYAGQSVKTVTSKTTATEKVITGNFEIEKVITDEDNDSGVVQKESGAEFMVVAKKYVEKYGSVEEAYNHKSEFTNKEYDYLTTDKNGYAKSKDLAYGTFVIKQVKGQMDLEMVKDTWEFTVSRENQDTIKYMVNNKIFRSYVRLVKQDKETGKNIVLSNTTFKIMDLSTNEILKQKVGKETFEEWTTDENGEFVLPLDVKAGSYKLIEIDSPDFYLMNTEGVEFRVTTSNIIETDSDGDAILTVVMKDTPVKGQIKVEKHGETLTSATKTRDGYTLNYENKCLAGMTVEIEAREDIIDPADGSIRYAKGTIVDSVTTGNTCENYSSKLPLGAYTVYEKTAPNGMIIDENSYDVDLTFEDEFTEVVVETVSVTNERQKVKLDVTKLDEETNEPLEGAVFGLYAKKDITNYNGEVIINAGTLIETVTSDENGKVNFKSDLPISIDDETYFEIKEIKAKEGYYLNEESVSVDTKYKGQTVETFTDKAKVLNKPIVNYIRVNKTDSITGEVIKGKDFTFGLCEDAECNTIIEKSEADKETGTSFFKIKYGKEMFIKELSAPENYDLSDEVIKVMLKADGLYVNDELVEVDEDLTYTFNYADYPFYYIQVNKTNSLTGEIVTGKDFSFGLCKDEDCNDVIEESAGDTETGIAQFKIEYDTTMYLKELSAPEGFQLSDESIKVLLTKDGLYINDELVEVDDDLTYSFDYADKPLYYVLVNKVDSITKENIKSKDFTFNLCTDYECNDVVKTYSANQDNGTALIDISNGIWFIKEESAPLGYSLSEEVVKVELNDDGLFVNDNKVETDEDLLYSIEYQNVLLPVIQTGVNWNSNLYLAIGGLSLVGALGTIILVIKKSKKRK